MWNFNAQFFPSDFRVGEGDRKAHSRIQQNVVIVVVAKITAEDVCIEPQIFTKGIS